MAIVIPSAARDPGPRLRHHLGRRGHTPGSLAALGKTACLV